MDYTEISQEQLDKKLEELCNDSGLNITIEKETMDGEDVFVVYSDDEVMAELDRDALLTVEDDDGKKLHLLDDGVIVEEDEADLYCKSRVIDEIHGELRHGEMPEDEEKPKSLWDKIKDYIEKNC